MHEQHGELNGLAARVVGEQLQVNVVALDEGVRPLLDHVARAFEIAFLGAPDGLYVERLGHTDVGDDLEADLLHVEGLLSGVLLSHGYSPMSASASARIFLAFMRP